MRFRLPIAAAALLAVAGGPLLAQGSSSEKPSAPSKVAGKTLDQWVKEITDGRDPGRRETAIRAVPYFGKPAVKEAVPALLKVLQNDPDVACKVYACLTLSGLARYVEVDAAGDAVRVLREEANKGQLIVRLHAVWALGSFGPKATAAIPVLIERIRDVNSWELRQAALSSLAGVAADKKFGPDPAAVAAVARLLSNGDEKSSQVRLAAVVALRVMGRPQEEKEFDLAKKALEKATRDPDKTVAIWALVALMTLDKVTAAHLSEVAQYLKGKDVMIKVNAATALGALGKDAQPHIPDIIDMLDDPDPLVVATAIDVLGGFGKAADKAVPSLRRVMEKKEHAEYFRQAAAAALKQITGTEVKLPAASPEKGSALTKPVDPSEVGGKTLDQWIKEIKSNPDPSVQETAMRVVPYFGKKAGAAAPALLTRLRDQTDIACRAHAVLALAAIADHVSDEDSAKAVKAITYILENDQAIMRYHAVTALGAYGPRAIPAIPALINRIHDRDSWEVRQSAISSLSTIAGNDKMGPDPRAVVAIANLLSSGEERSGAVRMMAVMALGALGRPANPGVFAQAAQALNHSLHYDRDKEVQIWAAVALMAVDRVTKEGLAEVAKHLKGKDVIAKLTAVRALGAMGKEAKPKIDDIDKLLDDDDPTVIAAALDVLAGLGSTARDAVPALNRFRDKIDQHKALDKDQKEYFKEAVKYTLEQIDGARK